MSRGAWCSCAQCSCAHPLSCRDGPAGQCRGVGVWVVEGIESLAAIDLELEALVEAVVDEFDRHPIGRLAPEERDRDLVVRAVGELDAGFGRGSHGDSF